MICCILNCTLGFVLDDIIPRALSLDLLSSEQRPNIVSLDKKKPQSFEPRKRCLTQTWSVVDGESTLKENCKSDHFYETLSSHSKPIISSWKTMLTHQEKILNFRKTNKADLQEQKSKLSDSHRKLSTRYILYIMFMQIISLL